MNSIFLTGGSGFVGGNLIKFLNDKFEFFEYKKEHLIKLNQNIVIHLAGKAHDLKKVSSFDEYYKVNTDLTKKIFDLFLASEAEVFITLSSVKAVADEIKGVLTEEDIPIPITHYGKSKLLAEQYILSQIIPENKRVYILRPCMIHGPGNKGNLNLLYKIVSKGIPWPLGAFDNKRSFCSIENLCFVIKELMQRKDIPSGIYNVADDEPLSTNQIISLIGEAQNKKVYLLNVPQKIIQYIAIFGNKFGLPLNSERLKKLTENYIVSNKKLIGILGKPLPIDSKLGIKKTFQSFNKHV